MLEKVSTGIPGLDKLLDGGFGKGFLVEIAGSAGTYKSTFAIQFAVEGVRKNEKVTYISLEEPKQSFEQLAEDLHVTKEFSKIDFETMGMDDLMSFRYSINPSGGAEAFANMLISYVEKPDRLVIDTATTTALYSSRTSVRANEGNKSEAIIPSPADIRIMLLLLADKLRKKGCTVLLLAEAGEGDLYIPEEMLKYICDGKIELKKSSLGTRTPRSLVIEKMRHINHTLDEQPIVLTKDGLTIEQIEQG
ncbi:MAG: AAA family ATPase [Candidatus Micrarchaeota archaeon]|nr:AAA family ATPase [Candidatus Micrarchaeota archaeon]